MKNTILIFILTVTSYSFNNINKMFIAPKPISSELVGKYLKLSLDYMNGRGVKKDGKKAIQYLLKIGDRNPLSYGIIGNIYSMGKAGVKKNYKKAIYYYAKTCELGFPIGCSKIAEIYKDRYKNYSKYLHYYKVACHHGNKIACYGIANEYYTGKNTKQDYGKALHYYTEACNKSDFKSCHIAAMLYQANDTWFDKNKTSKEYTVDGHDFTIDKNDTINQNITKAMRYYDKACDGNISVSCLELGYMCLKDINNTSCALKYFEKSCSLGYAKGCLGVGLAYEHTGNPKYKFKVLEYYKKSCDMNLSTACKLYKGAVSFGQRINKYKKKCELNVSSSCINLGIFYQTGGTVYLKKDMKMAVRLYTKACYKLHDGEGCDILGDTFIYSKENYDLDGAISCYKRGCDLSYAGACYNEAIYTIVKFKDKDSVQKAKKLYQKACKLGFKQSCKAYNYLLKNRDSNITTESNATYNQKDTNSTR